MPNPNLTGEAMLKRGHLYYNNPNVVNEFMARVKFDAASDAAAVAAAGAGNKGAAAGDGADDAAAKATADKVAADAAAKAAAEKPAGSIMDDAAKEAKAAEDAENKRLLEAKEEDLNDADKTKRAALIEANKKAEAAKGAPEKYDFKVPEGMVLDQAMVDKVTPIFKEAKISQEVAQKIVDLYSDKVKADAQAQKETFDKFVEGLKAETIKELGADYKQQLSFAAKTRDRFASPELVEKLNESGLANDKDMIKLFITIGKAVSEDKPPEGKPGPAGEKSAGAILFPSANPS